MLFTKVYQENKKILFLACNAFIGLFMSFNAFSGQVYTLSDSGVIRALVDDNCTVSDCEWTELDRNPQTKQIVADEGGLYQLHDNGSIWRFTGRPCDTDWCRGWEKLDNNPRTEQIIASDGKLYQRHDSGSIFQFTGRACSGSSCPGWQMLDVNPSTTQIVAGGSELYQRHSSGAIFRYTGTPCSGWSCPGWELIDRNSSNIDIVAADDKFYRLQSNGRIYEFTNRVCDSSGCLGWRMLDNNSRTEQIVADRNSLYQRHSSGLIYRYTGRPCSGSSCPGWQLLDNNSYTDHISASDGALIQTHRNGNVWQFTGATCNSTGCPGWKRIGFVSNLKNANVFMGDALLAESILDENLAQKTGYKMRPVSGTRPLLLIVADVQQSDGTRLFNLSPLATYTQLVFGGHASGLGVTDFFRLSSSNNFRFSNAGTIRVSLRGNNITPSQFVSAASRAGIDFSTFDRNNDGVVSYNELNLLVIDNITRGLGATRWINQRNNGVRINLPISLAGGQSIFSNFTHEVAHALHGVLPADLYGSGCNLQNRTLLGHCTARNTPVTFDTDSIDLSPWNKSRFGWVQPEIQYSNMKGACRAMIAPSYSFAKENSVLLYNPNRSDKEFFMFEHRNSVQRSNFHPYDQDFIGKGIAPYYVNWTNDDETNIFVNPNGSQDRLMLMSTNPGTTRRGSLLTSLPVPLTYFNGDDTETRARGSYKSWLDEAVSYFEWDRGTPIRPRIKSAEDGGTGIVEYTATQNGQITLRGQFGVSTQGRRAFLVRGNERISVRTSNWSCDQLTLNIPDTATRGETYDLVMTHNDWDSEHTVDVKIRVR
ncbi:MAG: hypothetical protein HWE27_03900 [Gammaproteobacteria bacterium]|nr:hypothetical protein [Gammaproteobacteria bacterium]